MKDWPIFGEASTYASRLVLAAGVAGHYEDAHRALMGTEGKLTKEQIDARLGEAGFNTDRLMKAYQAHAERIDGLLARNNLQAEAFRFRGTPSYVVQTTLYPGVMKQSDLAQAIDEARAK